jgi:threonine dehydratase
MPTNTAPVKVAAVRGYGAQVIFSEPSLASREATAARVVAETGGHYLSPYNHPAVIAGQGTVALEFLEQVSDLDALIAPVGGGGLISGLCIAARAIQPGIRLFAAEPAGADDAFRSKQSGRLLPQTSPDTIADGLRTSLGELTWPYVRDVVEQVLTVSESEIVAAMRWMWERAKLMIEPSSAVPVAALLGPGSAALTDARRVGVVLSGGNVDLDHLPW